MNQETQRDPSRVQGGDLTHLPDGLITLNLSLCTNRLGPPPGAVAALHHFLDHHAHRLMPPPYEAPSPPYRAERLYLQAVADRLGVNEQDMLPGRGVTEFLVILARLLRPSRVAVITPEYTETMRLFSYADFHGPADGVQDTADLRLQRLRAAMRTHDHVVLSNPSNPMGHYLPRAQLIQACAENPAAVLVVDEEYIEFQGPGLSLAGADVTNLIVLQSTGKTYGITATRAGMLWTRNSRLHRRVQDELPSWPLSLLDITLATAALRDTAWLPTALGRTNTAARRLQTLLTGRFGTAVADSDIHYRFLHLDNPYPALEHLHAHGISGRLFTRTARGSVPGLRLMTPTTDAEFEQLRTALNTLPEGRPA
ncbi:aminotransferase class I/II-fold pyridoxal phosphate-dependent enzyme [Streptomyces albipurpureus]|uniref:Aminotransferase class I/II-fold pyridoxal phosphate-dependent enzyme n=1 Tax=Streptomyces albipurpureus TaxID=2897419 RepID=A0ABT0UW65_9ACTN|nr:aminotransferase class I/II-fold pyridoxal phosphate-dependent enzyme [Streptomyces sp. CWNU-1]MCM2392671.1 aminotransferase class I/II-fold pyridoxal phosphate-dependent enzyme [Streptomyces sp. CWNU-1]